MKRLMMLLIGVLLMVPALFGQIVEIPPITDVLNLASRFPELLGSLGGVILMVIFIPPILIGWFKVEKKGWKYTLTEGVILILTVLAFVLNVGFLHGEPIWFVLVVLGLLSLGQVLGYTMVKTVFKAIQDKFNPKGTS